MNNPLPPDTLPTSRRAGWRLTAAAAVLLVIAAGVWLRARSNPQDAATAAQAALPSSGAQAAATTAARLAALTQSAQPAASGPAPAPAAKAVAASQPSLPPVEAPAESLRKVQVALGGGTPDDALAAGLTLVNCKHAKQMADSLFQTRDLAPLLPPDIKKALDKFGPVTNEQIDRAQQEQRRCQVFDAATLARAGELLGRAYEGGAQGAASAYLTWLQHDGPGQADPALLAKLQTQVRTSIEAGDMNTLMQATFGPASDFGATPSQAQAYREAWLRISDELNPGSAAATKTLLENMDQLKHTPPLTAEQQSAADALAQQIVDAWHKTQHKGG